MGRRLGGQVKIYNITFKLAKSTSTINVFITNLQPNHQQMLANSTIYNKGTPNFALNKNSRTLDYGKIRNLVTLAQLLPNLAQTHLAKFKNSRNFCSRIIV
jgi:hypothetical protein